MSRKLTSRSSLENLKREAKRWLKALRENDAEARARFAAVIPDPNPEPTLRDVQHALALEYGHPGWSSLKAAIDAKAGAGDDLAALMAAANAGDTARAAELLDADPSIVSERGTSRGTPDCERRSTSVCIMSRSCACCSTAVPIQTFATKATTRFRCTSPPNGWIWRSFAC